MQTTPKMRFIRETIAKENQIVNKLEQTLVARHLRHPRYQAIKLEPLEPINRLPEAFDIGYMCVPEQLDSSIGHPHGYYNVPSPLSLYHTTSPFARKKICETEFYTRNLLPSLSRSRIEKLPLIC